MLSLSLSLSLSSRGLLLLVFAFALSATGVAQRIIESTHDWANRIGPAEDAWADVKVGGNGWVYSVGTTEAPTTDPQAVPPPLFSNIHITPDLSVPTRPGTSQVVVIQARDSTGTVAWQRYFCGAATLNQPNGLMNYARAIAVYLPEGSTEPDWRIAICGETYDTELPRSPPTLNSNELITKGFVAVYNGSGDLLWSWLFYPWGMLSANGNTAITDVAIHVEGSGASAVDVVTYCGFTQCGAGTGGNLGTFREVPAGILAGCDPTPFNYPSGAGLLWLIYGNQRDGLVGRLTAPHVNPLPSQVVLQFQSFVGGDRDDALMAIAELSEDRFVVVGTATLNGTVNLVPPITTMGQGACPSRSGGTVGYVAVFDAAPTRLIPAGNLLLEHGELVGVTATIPPWFEPDFLIEPRDVAILGDCICIAGMTNHPNLPGAQNTLVANTTRAGFVLQLANPGGLITSVKTTYYVQPVPDPDAECELVGIGGWPEFDDHIYCVGWIERKPTQSPIVLPARRHAFVESLFRDTPNSATPHNLVLLRRWTLDDSMPSSFRPSCSWGGAVGTIGMPSEAESGGIAVDGRGRVTIVGSTSGSAGGLPNPTLPPETGHGLGATGDMGNTLDRAHG